MTIENLKIERMCKYHEEISGARKDLDGKIMLELVSPEMILALGEVLTYGAQKYEPRNWEKGIMFTKSYAAAMRHLMQWLGGVDKDEESGLAHIEQAMLNLGMIVTQTRRGRADLDDRPPLTPGPPLKIDNNKGRHIL